MILKYFKKNGTSGKVFTAGMTFYTRDIMSVLSRPAELSEIAGGIGTFYDPEVTVRLINGAVKIFKKEMAFDVVFKLRDSGFYTEEQASEVVDYLKGQQNEY